MRGKVAKRQRRLLARAVNENAAFADAAHRALWGFVWSNFWSQVAIAALLQHLANNRLEPADPKAGIDASVVDFSELERAVLFVPPEGEEGPKI